jgi:Cys-tRNA(Pro)/Cys-tRNA(Cys) deacylase
MNPEIRELLTGAGVEFTVHHHSPVVAENAPTAYVAFDAQSMVKSLAFQFAPGSHVIVGMRASDRVDYKKVADAVGVRRSDLRMADADEVSRVLDMQPGGITPLPVSGATVLLDRAVADLGTIFCGTGRNDTTLQISSVDLIRVAGARLGDFVKHQ